jgi:hypothetical protein
MEAKVHIEQEQFLQVVKCKEIRIIITNLACDETIMKIMQNSFIHRFVHFTHEYHESKIRLTHKEMC